MSKMSELGKKRLIEVKCPSCGLEFEELTDSLDTDVVCENCNRLFVARNNQKRFHAFSGDSTWRP